MVDFRIEELSLGGWPALLYHKLGFREAYRYWYRRK